MNVSPTSATLPMLPLSRPIAETDSVTQALAPCEFIPAHRECDQELLELYYRETVDIDGIFIGKDIPDFPPLEADASAIIDQWIDQVFTTKSNEGAFTDGLDDRSIDTIKATMREALAFIIYNYPIMFIGSSARYALQKWFEKVINAIARADNFVKNSKLHTKEVFDFDLRIKMDGQSFDVLSKMLDHFLLYFAAKLTSDPDKLNTYRAAFRRLGKNNIQDQLIDELYTMFSIRDAEKGHTADFNFVSRLSRENLFTLDAANIDITDFVHKRGPAKIDTSNPRLLVQCAIDNRYGLIHAVDPNSISYRGCLPIIKCIASGNRVAQEGLLEILFKKLLLHKSLLTNRLQTYWLRHIKDESRPMQHAFILNTITRLFRHCGDAELRQNVIVNLLNRFTDCDHSFLSKILHFLKANPDQYELLEAWLQLTGLLMISGATKQVSLIRDNKLISLQWHEESGHWTIPLNPKEALARVLQCKGTVLNTLQDLIYVESTPGYFYKCHNYLVDQNVFTQGMTHPDPAVRRVCTGLAVLMHTRNSPENHNRIVDATSNVDSLLRNVLDLDFSIFISSILPEVKQWNRSGKFLFERFILKRPDLAVDIFANRTANALSVSEERDLFCKIVQSYQRKAGLNGEALVRCGLKLRSEPVQKSAKKQKKLPDITSQILWTASPANNNADPVNQLTLISRSIAEKLLIPKQFDEKLLEYLEYALKCSRIPSEKVYAIWKNGIADGFFQNPEIRTVYVHFLGLLASHHGQDECILTSFLKLNLTEVEKIELQEMLKGSNLSNELLTQKQKYDQAIGKLRESIKLRKNVFENWKLADACAEGTSEHNDIVKETFCYWCKNHIDGVINLFSIPELKHLWTAKHSYNLLVSLNANDHHQLIWKILKDLLSVNLQNEELIQVFEIISKSTQCKETASKQIKGTACAWIDKHLSICSKTLQATVISATHYLGFSDLSNTDVIFEAVQDDLELAHHALASLHHEGRSYTPKQLGILKQLANHGTMDRQLFWRKRLLQKHKAEVMQEIPLWVKDLYGKNSFKDAIDLLSQYNDSNRETLLDLWQDLLKQVGKADLQKTAEIYMNLKKRSLVVHDEVLLDIASTHITAENSDGMEWIKFMKAIAPFNSILWLKTFYFLRNQWQEKYNPTFAEMTKVFLKTRYWIANIPLPMSADDIECIGVAAECLKVKNPMREVLLTEAVNQTNMQGIGWILANKSAEVRLSVCDLLLDSKDAPILLQVYLMLAQTIEDTPYCRTLLQKALRQAAQLNTADFNLVYANLKSLYNIRPFAFNPKEDQTVLDELGHSIQLFPFREISITFTSSFVKTQCLRIKRNLPVLASSKKIYLELIEGFVSSPSQTDDLDLLKDMFDHLFTAQFSDTSACNMIAIGYSIMLMRTSESENLLKEIHHAHEMLPNLKNYPKCQKAIAAEMIRGLIRWGFSCDQREAMCNELTRTLIAVCENSKSLPNRPDFFKMEGHCRTVAPSYHDILSFKPKDSDHYFYQMSELIRALCTLDISHFDDIKQFQFWLSYTGALLESLLYRIDTGQLGSKSQKTEILVNLIEMLVFANIPNIPSVFQLHSEYCQMLLIQSAIEKIKSEHETAFSIKFAIIFVGVMCSDYSIKSIKSIQFGNKECLHALVDLFIQFSTYANIERVVFGLKLLYTLQYHGTFNTHPDEFARIYQAFTPLLAKYPLTPCTLSNRDLIFIKDFLLWSFGYMCSQSLKSPPHLESNWDNAIGKIAIAVVKQLHIGHEMLLQTNPQYEDSTLNVEMFNTLILAAQFGFARPNCAPLYDTMKHVLPSILNCIKRAHRLNCLEKILSQDLHRHDPEAVAAELKDENIIDPLFLFREGRLMTDKDKRSRQQLFEEWMKLIIGWKEGYRFYMRLETAQRSFQIFPAPEDYKHRFAEILNAHISNLKAANSAAWR